jgi:hypothetical protein
MPSRQTRIDGFLALSGVYAEAGGDADALAKFRGLFGVLDKWRNVLIEHVERYERGVDSLEGDALRARLRVGDDEATEEALGALMRRLFFRPEGLVGVAGEAS